MKITTEERIRRLLTYCLHEPSLSVGEAPMIRLLKSYYEKILDRDNIDDFIANLHILDAMKDCIHGNEDGMDEWSISKTGVVRFR